MIPGILYVGICEHVNKISLLLDFDLSTLTMVYIVWMLRSSRYSGHTWKINIP